MKDQYYSIDLEAKKMPMLTGNIDCIQTVISPGSPSCDLLIDAILYIQHIQKQNLYKIHDQNGIRY